MKVTDLCPVGNLIFPLKVISVECSELDFLLNDHPFLSELIKPHLIPSVWTDEPVG